MHDAVEFSKLFHIVLSLDSCKCLLLGRLGKIYEPHFVDWNIFFRLLTPLSAPGGFWDLWRPQN